VYADVHYRALKFDKSQASVVNAGGNPLICVTAPNGDVWNITEVGMRTPPVGAEFLELIERVYATVDPTSSKYDKVETVKFPEVRLLSVSGEEYEGLRSRNGFMITEAKITSTLVLDKDGATASTRFWAEAVAIGVMASGGPITEVVIDREFLLWLDRPGVGVVFAAYVAKDSWVPFEG
jgi:hypothetical protein